MRIVLVHPAGSNWVPGRRDITPIANRMAPLGLLSMAAWLEKQDHRVSVYDCLGYDRLQPHAAIVRDILAGRPDLVGFSATTSGFLDGYDLAVALKQQRAEILTVFGGVHVSALGACLLENYPAIDYLCLGEGEATLAELADGLPPAEIDGLVWRDGDTIVSNPVRRLLPDLDQLPFPAYAKLRGFPQRYHLPLFSYIRPPGATMVTSRGCPYQCSYCDRSVFKQGYRYNSAAYIYAHLRYLRDRFGVRHVNIYDDLFTAHRKRIAELCTLLIAKPLGMQFNCAVRVGHADDDLLQMLKAAGGLMVSLGIESGDMDLMDRHKPGVELEGVKDTVRRIQASGLRAKGLFMMGLPGETEASIRKTSDFIMSLDLDDMNMSKFTPFHGAPAWRDLQEHGSLQEDWRRMNCLNFVFLPRGISSREALDELYNQHVKRFYSSPAWRHKFRRRLWEHRWSLWHMIVHLPDFLAAKNNFEPRKDH
ncbi:MAG: radical SAM protein [Desulfobacterales bacterium]|jgi:magnesium-protoporphyrin IX monomethyl ester (oxidative) cyclase